MRAASGNGSLSRRIYIEVRLVISAALYLARSRSRLSSCRPTGQGGGRREIIADNFSILILPKALTSTSAATGWRCGGSRRVLSQPGQALIRFGSKRASTRAGRVRPAGGRNVKFNTPPLERSGMQ
jgi:hypothetical protein